MWLVFSLPGCCFSSDRTLQEPLPELTAAELAREAEQEAAVFAQAVNVDKLLTMLRTIDSSGENLADNEEIQVRVLKPPCVVTLNVLAGTLSFLHVSSTEDRQAHRQIQPETR